jgi:subtilisin
MQQILRRYVVLPVDRYRSETLQLGVLQSNGRGLQIAARPGSNDHQSLNVLDEIYSDGPKLVELTEQGLYDLRAEYDSKIRIIPLTYFSIARATPGIPARKVLSVASTGVDSANTVYVKDRQSGAALGGARILAFTNFRSRVGIEALTDAEGKAEIEIALASELQRLYVFGPPGYWGYFARNTRLGVNSNIMLDRIVPSDSSYFLSKCYGQTPNDAGNGVRIGIIDSGVDSTHPDLKVVGGHNVVYDEITGNPNADVDFGPANTSGGEHGTHVAGIAAARGIGSGRFRGVAPGAEIIAYRVFPKNGTFASNYDIAKAIDWAVRDGCQVINLSLGGPAPDELSRLAIEQAVNAGVLVVAASGNERSSVGYPAAYPGVVGVSACGLRGTFPDQSTEQADRAKPFGDPDRNWFAAAFTNSGPQIDFVGPGVGIVSTLPGGQYGVMSGTSMASPAIAGFAAYILSTNQALIDNNTAIRGRWLFSEIQKRGRALGLGAFFEGFGLPK